MNKIKEKLINASNKQEIHDLSSNIINKVDTSKVLVPTDMVRRKPRWVPVLLSAIPLTAVFLLGLSIPFITNSVKNSNGKNPGKTVDPITPIETVDDSFDFSNISYEEAMEFMSMMESHDVYNIITAANTFDKLTYDNVILDDASKPRMTESEENQLVNDISLYMPTIEAMYGLREEPTCIKKNNNNESFEYSKKIEVRAKDFNYDIYLDEIILGEKNVGEANYKSDSSVNGVVVIEASEYEFNGTFKYVESEKNKYFEYVNVVTLPNNKTVKVKEVFKKDRCEYTYTYTDHLNDLTREIFIEQKIDLETSKTREVSFKNGYTSVGSIKPTENDYLRCKIQSRDSDYIIVSKDEDSYKYVFNNSKNEYLK